LSEFDLRALLAALHEHEVHFVVIGGVAVGAHGFLRSTEDLDLVPDPNPANLKRLTAALEDLDATMPTVEGRPFDPDKDGAVVLRGGDVTADTRFGGLDVVQKLRGVPTYSELAQDAVESDLLGIPVRVCSLGRPRAMKQTLSRAQDQVDLENLPRDSTSG
jgi:hypothetical protein